MACCAKVITTALTEKEKMSEWSEEYRRGYIHGKSKGIKKGLKMRKDYVRVVRCKDCKFYSRCTDYQGICTNRYMDGFIFPDWYCADGERKDDE